MGTKIIDGSVDVTGNIAANQISVKNQSNYTNTNGLLLLNNRLYMSQDANREFSFDNRSKSTTTFHFTETSDITIWVPGTSGTLALIADIPGEATTSSKGLMSANDKSKLDKLPTLELAVKTSWTWGTLTTGNGYTQKFTWDELGGGSVAFAAKGGQTSMQIDGRYYDQEGKYQLINTNDLNNRLNSYVPTSRTVNGHALTSNISVTASDVGLGSVANAGQSAIYTTKDSDGTKYFTQNGAYNMYRTIKNSISSLIKSTSEAVSVGNSLLPLKLIGSSEKISYTSSGSTRTVNLMTSDDYETLKSVLEDKQDKLTAGANITISNNTISAGISNGAVTNAKIADGAVTNAKIADGTIESSKLKDSYALASNLSTEASARASADSGLQNQIDDKVTKSGDTFSQGAMFYFPDSGNWGNSGVTYPYSCGGFQWNDQSDGIQLYGEATANDNLDLVLKFTDDNSNKFSIRNASGTQTAYITANGSGYFTGGLTLQGESGSSPSGSVTKITFISEDVNQTGYLWFSDYDSYQAPASLTFGGSQGGEYFIAPNIKATSNLYGLGFQPTATASYSTTNNEFSSYSGNPCVNTRTNIFTVAKMGANGANLRLDKLSGPYDFYFPAKSGTFTLNEADNTFTGKTIINSGKINISGGLADVGGTRPGANNTLLASNGIIISNTGTPNDQAWIRNTGTGEGDNCLEIATGDDGSADFNIHFRGYNTGNTVVHDIVMPKDNGTIALTKNIPTALKNPNTISFTNASNQTVTYDGSSAVDLTGGVYYANSAGTATSATTATSANNANNAKYATSAGTATNLTNTPELLIDTNKIAVKAGEKISNYITVPYATSAGTATSANYATSAGNVYNGTLTIQKNGTTVTTFGANQSSNTTANITVPTKTSELSNDSSYTTLADGIPLVAGSNITLTETSNGLQINAASSSVPTMSSTTIGGAKLWSGNTQSTAPTGLSATAYRTYAIQLNSSSQLVVNVPWCATRLNSNYYYSYSSNTSSTERYLGSLYGGEYGMIAMLMYGASNNWAYVAAHTSSSTSSSTYWNSYLYAYNGVVTFFVPAYQTYYLTGYYLSWAGIRYTTLESYYRT